MVSVDGDPDFFETIVVGSGFGGSVAALRLAEANGIAKNGERVCLLERGRAFAPGEFPRAPWDFATNFWQPDKGQQGLFDIWSFKGCESVVSAGLGGGSLIYSNALVSPRVEWLDGWPIRFTELEQYFPTVEGMLHAQRFPADSPGYKNVVKAPAMERAAKSIGKYPADFEYPQLAVSFRDTGGTPGTGLPLSLKTANYHQTAGTGHGRTTCTLCGQCNIGCNQGSKNTLDHTYISAAQAAGAIIRTGFEVKEIMPVEVGGRIVSYRVRCLEHRIDADGTPITADEPRILTCRRLVLSAGTFGTTYLLLKSREKGNLKNVSPVLGKRFSTNGDFLMWMSGATKPNGKPLQLNPSVGLPVTAAIRYDKFFIEDAGYPVIADWLMAAKSGLVLRAVRFLAHYLWANLMRNASGRISHQIGLVVGTGGAGANAMPLGAMGLDKPDGEISLRAERRWLPGKRRKRLQVDWSMNTSADYFKDVSEQMTIVADALGAKIAPSALSRLNRTITVHPLGGCPMGTSPADGVCDKYGEVFGYQNLFIADGSVMPSPIGANPSLTIAAFSEHMVAAIVRGDTSRPLTEAHSAPGSVPMSPTPGQPTKMRIALTIPGAVALGAYEAGVLAALINALRGLNASGQAEIEIDVIGSSSSGSLTGLLAARCLLEGLDPMSTLSRAWVKNASLSRLIGHDFNAPLAVSKLREDALTLLDAKAAFGPRSQPQSGSITLTIGVENLRGLAYRKDVVAPRSYATVTHLDWIDHTVKSGMSVADLTEPAHESVLDAVLASAANQLAFAAQLLKMRRAGAYQDVENWPASNEFWCSDSAILDREPISRTLQVTADIDDESTAGMRRHLVIEPQPRVAGRETQWAARNAPPTWLKTLLRTLAIVEGQTVYDDISAFEDRNLRAAKVNALISRLEPALDDLPMDATRALREALGGSGDQSLTNLVRAKVSEAADVDGREPATVEVISPDLVKLNPGPVNDRLAGEFLFRFGGLLDENLRQSDFDLGYLSTISWLEHEPERPEGAPDGNTEVPALKLGRDARMFAAAVARRANPRVEELRPGWRPPELSMRGRLRMLRFFHRVAVVGAHDVYVGRRDRRRTLSAVG